MDLVDFIQQFLLNTAIVSASMWTLLRFVEKIFDVLLKKHQYEQISEKVV